MSAWLWIIATLLAVAALGWVFRAGGRWVTGNAPRFRDMSYGEAFGFALAAAALAGGTWLYLQPGAVFFRWAVQGFVIFAVAAYLFRELGRLIGTEGTRKLFRQMPLTAAFGILVILVYSFVAIFAGQISLRTVIIVAVVGMILTEIVRRNTGDAAATGFGGLVFAVNLVFVVMYLVGPIAPHGQEQVFELANVVAGGDPALGGNPDFPLGTDRIGRDMLSRLIYGARNTVGIAFATTALAFVVGSILGLWAALTGGWLDQLLSRFVDALMSIPALIFSLLLLTIFGTSVLTLILVIAAVDATRVFRLARAVAQGIVVMDYIEAAKLRGEGAWFLIRREILPNAMAPLVAEFGLRFCFVFLTISSLSFLGLGIKPPTADWGSMVRDNATLITFGDVTPLLPAGCIALLTVAVNFVVDWQLHRASGLKE